MKKEREIRISDLIQAMWKKSLMIMISAIAFGGIFAAIKVYKNYSYNNEKPAVLEESNDLKKAKLYKKENEQTQRYIDESILMSADAFNLYKNDTLLCVLGDNGYESYAKIYSYIESKVWADDLAEMMGDKYSESALSEVVKVNDNFDWNKYYLNETNIDRNNWYIQIAFVGKSDEMVQNMQKSFMNILDTYINEQIENVTIQIVSSEVVNFYDSDLAKEKSKIYEMQRDYANITALISKNLNINEKAMLNGQEVVLEKKDLRDGVVKYFAFGIIVGVLASATVIVVLFVCSNKLKSISSLEEDDELLVFGSISDDESNALVALELFCKKNNIKSLYITSSIENFEKMKYIGLLKQKLEQIDVDITYGKSCIYGAKEAKRMAEAEAVLMIESVGKTEENKLDEVLSVGEIVSANIIGVIAV